jgi:hypothetical protein
MRGDDYEARGYWKIRKDLLYDNYFQAFHIAKDREAMADFRKAWKKYNEDVPDKAMRITNERLQQSAKLRQASIDKRNAMIAPEKAMQGVSDRVVDRYAE